MQKQPIKWMSRTQSINCDFKTNNFNLSKLNFSPFFLKILGLSNNKEYKD